MKPTSIVIYRFGAPCDEGKENTEHRYAITPAGKVIASGSAHALEARADGGEPASVTIYCKPASGKKPASARQAHRQVPLPEAQYRALVALVCELAGRYSIPPKQILLSDTAASCEVNKTQASSIQTENDSLLDTLRARVELCCKPEQAGCNVTYELAHDGLATVSGTLRGALFHRVLPENPKEVSWVRITLTMVGQTEPVWSARAPLTVTTIGEAEGSFLFTVPQHVLSPGCYECTIVSDVTTRGADNREPPECQRFLIDVPICSARTVTIPPIRAHIVAERVRDTSPYVFRLKGSAINTGSLPWCNDNDLTPYRVGLLVFAADGERQPLRELRYDLPYERIEVGEEVAFSFTFDTGELPLGEYDVYVDIVRERRYWFAELGSQGNFRTFKVMKHRQSTLTQSEHLLNPPNSWASSPKSASMLYIAPTLPLFDRSTGGRRLIDMFTTLRKVGVEITYLYEQLGTATDIERYTSALDQLGITHAPDPVGYLLELDDSSRFNLVVLGWYYTAAAVIGVVRDVLPHVRVAVDSNDIHWARNLRAEDAGLPTMSPEFRASEHAKEVKVYSQADEVWVVSEDEAEIVTHELPSVKWRVVGIPCKSSDAYVKKLRGDRVLFVGGFRHLPNESAALWAAEIVSQFNQETNRSVTLDIVGSDPPPSVRSLADDPDISVPGYVADLDGYHNRAKVFLAPLRYGGGVKGKISDAICRGVPVITNAVGNEGLRLEHGKEILLGETTQDFVQLLRDVYAGRYDLEKIRKNARTKMLSMYGDEAIRAQMLSAIVAPHVVIGIVTYNQRELLRACLQSIIEKTSYPNFSVAVVSNGCTDGTREMLEEFSESNPNLIDIDFSDTNDFFVRPCNQIINRYTESDIVLVNNDVEVIHPGWLTNLVDAAYSSRAVCGSGGLIFDGQGVVSEAGAEIYATGMGRNLYRGSTLVSGSALTVRSVGFVSGCLMYMRRDAIRQIGALDEEYHPMYFEDVAWHYTAHCHGLKTLYTPWARIIHREGSSAGQDVSKGMKRYQEINRRKFLAKFKGINIEQFNFG